MIQAYIFDLDGVIVDTAVYHYRAWKRLANELGFDFTEAQNEALKGISRARSLQLILEWGGVQRTPAEQKELAGRKNEWYVEMISRMTPDEILPGAKELLAQAKDVGIRTALGSASKNAGIILERTGLLPLFDVIVDGNTVSASKPDPEVFLQCAAKLGIAPAHCMIFEDAIAGIAAARAAGMKVIGIGDAAVLTGADAVLPGLQDMTIAKLQTLTANS
ncbi:beta-phosphoglucomutase [Chitinophaga japonensis]|uniref:Beta-phosphoglucomutase n=1 Tax=Chitinophaga japonensis TaxID=104662 RepID=A0A562STK9_CHIJA|nr:beta-phosphoglucomutase [Chitinophaga japonensis]TWI84542.1 beta-phosphoglucomutase [Chitinophaga japonensis]